MEGAYPSNKFQGVGNTWQCRTGTPVKSHFSICTRRAGDSIKANSKGTIPSPNTSPPILPSKGKYELAATNCSTLVVRNVPLRLELPTQVMSMPRSVNAWEEQAGDSAISLNKPRVWSTKAVSGEICGVPKVMSDVHRSWANTETAVEDLYSQ